MSTCIDIKANEVGVVRVFGVDLDPKSAEGFNRRNGRWPLKEALGAEVLEAHYIDLIQIEDLADVGLSQYLEQGMGVTPQDLAQAQVLIEGLTGMVLVIGSGAFCGHAQVLTPQAPLRLVATFNEEKPLVSFEKLPSEGAVEVASGTKKQPSDAAMSGRVATLALLVLFGLTGLVIWVAS